MNDAANPLAAIQFRVPFDRIRAEHVEPAAEALLAEAGEALDSLARQDGPPTFANTLLRLDRCTEKLDYAISVVKHLESVATYPELRRAFRAVYPKVSAFYSGIPRHGGLWKVLQTYAGSPEANGLDGVRRRFLDKTLADFRRHGANLDPAGKEDLERIDVELAKLTTRFAENTLDSTNAFEYVITDEAALAGLPPSALDMARDDARAKGKDGWRFTLQGPSYFAVMTYLHDGAVREHFYRAYNTRAAGGEFDNTPILARVLELRRAKARQLGYPDYADFVLEERMAKTGANAQAFLEELRSKTETHFHRENQELVAFRREIEGPTAPLAPWDVAYYAEKLRQARFDFNEEDLRPYFPLERVVAGMFELARRLFGVRVEEEPDVSAWDPATRYYRLLDEDGTLLGAFYTDWYPRENKRGGAWMDSLLVGGPADGEFLPHLGLMCGNLQPPAGGKPALLIHRDVETIFHEFGHLLHHLLSRVPVRTLAGTNVAWDFVELPSQIMENWCWEREALDLFAAHHETGAPIPADLFAKMKRARTFRAANAQMRQLSFGFLDLALHRSYDPERDGPVTPYCRKLVEPFSPAPLPEDYAMVNSFTHLFSGPNGYAAAYYSYKWAEVLEADAFSRFRNGGIFSREIGNEFRRKILERGDSDDPAQLYRDFMGRDPDTTALLRRQGLL